MSKPNGLFQKCIQNHQLLLILYTLLNQMRVLKKKCYIIFVIKYFYKFLTILLGIVPSSFTVKARIQFPGYANLQLNFFSLFSFSSCRNHQTFLIRLATFKILSPERASQRKGMSTVEQFIWVNLYSLDLMLDKAEE